MWYWPSQDPPGPPTLLDAVRETIEIGERTGVTVVASHIKAKGANFWGSSGAAVQLIDRARARGVPVWADQYPYPTSGSDGGTVLIPSWVFATVRRTTPSARDYSAALRSALSDLATAAKIRSDIGHEIQRRGGAENVIAFEYPDSTVVGASLAEVAGRWKLEPVTAAIELQLRGDPRRPGGGRFRGFSMAEIDIEAFAAKPWVATASDAGIALPEDGPDVHARFYGTFPRKIRRYALERGVIGLEAAIRSMTSLPAQIMGWNDRGIIREGAAADLVVFDLGQIRDKATFFAPHGYAEGIEYVLVNGEPVVDAGRITWKLPGRVLAR
jgi:N-acyl-D-amino-acid deacylase